MNYKLLKTFFDKKLLTFTKAKGIYLYTAKNEKYTDLTGGSTGHAILGWSNKKIINDVHVQLKKFGHLDYKNFNDPNREKLAELLLSNSKIKLNKVFFVGSSGAEACEAAMKMSFQYFYDKGFKKKKIYISRKQSYHGCTTHSLSLGDRPNLYFYKPILSKNVYKISEHNEFRHKKNNENSEAYAARCANELEQKIIKLGPENVCAFIGETIMGGLVGDVPPSNYYWKKISNVCKKYNVHLILDEVWCGTGTTGKPFCIDWDNVNPDFVFLSKTLAAGYGALSAVVTNSKITDVLKHGQGQVQYSSTHQGHSVSVAAALSVQKIINNKIFLFNVVNKGELFRKYINSELKDNDFFLNVRGRGMRNTLEYNSDNNQLFGAHLKNKMLQKYKTIIDAKWHRVCFPMAINISRKELEDNLAKFISVFKNLSNKWPVIKKNNIKSYYF